MSNVQRTPPTGNAVRNSTNPSAQTSEESQRPAMTTKLSTLRRGRTIQRKRLIEDDDAARSYTAVTPENRPQILELAHVVDMRLANVLSFDQQILNHPDLPESDEEKEIEESDVHQEKARRCIAYIKCLLDEYRSNESARTAALSGGCVSPTSSGSGHGRSATLSTSEQHAPAPSVVIAPPPPVLDVSPDVFDGAQLSYRLWRSQFKNWIDRRTTATGSDRLVALLKLLRGPPRDLIKNLDINDANYETALELLDSNYGQVDVERKKVMAGLVNVPTVGSPGDISGLRKLLNHVQGSIMSMKGLGIPLSQYALIYETSISAAIPERVMFEYEDSRRRDELIATRQSQGNSAGASGAASNEHSDERSADRIKSIIEFLQRYTNHKEQSILLHQQPRSEHQRQSPFQHPFQQHRQPRPNGMSTRQPARYPPRGGKQSTVAPVMNPRKYRPCFFCNDKSHPSSRCTSNLSYRQRCEIIDKQDRCLVCFRRRHTENVVCPGTNSECQTCKGRGHYTSMHPPEDRQGSQQTSVPVVASAAAPADTPSSLVMTASAHVVHGGSRLPVRLFLDTGSMISFVAPSLIEKLPGVRPLCKTDLQVQAFASTHTITTQRYRIRLASCHDDQIRVDVAAYSYDFGVNPLNDCPLDVTQKIRSFGQLHPLADKAFSKMSAPEAPALLIGMDQFYKIVQLKLPQLITDDIVATETRFGWVVGGQISVSSDRMDVARVHPVCCAASLSKPARDVERLWSLEAIGIQDTTEGSLSGDEAEALRQFRQGMVYDGHSYTVTMPKRPSITELANNKDTACRRLLSKRRSLLRDTEAFDRYNAEVMSFVDEGHAEEVTDSDRSQPGDHDGNYYMPHHQVVTQVDGRQKWRIVFDCSSSAPGQTSLNSHLLPGPNLNPDLVKLMINFRLHQVAVSADITRAYMMLNLAEADRPLFRFLWQGPADDSIRCFQMKKVTWGAAPSGFLLAATLREIFRRVDPAAVNRLGDSLYHDDMLRSFASESEAIEFIEKVIPWFGSANMRLAKWKTNAPAVVTHLKENGVPASDACLVEGGLLKVLGIAWSPTEDQFRFQLTSLARDASQLSRVTKRVVLRFIASVFDPCGWLLPYTLRGKKIIQLLWTTALRWDETVSASLLESFKQWTAELNELIELHIPRQYSSAGKVVKVYYLHMFADASEVAYATVAYLQSLYDDGTSECSLLMAKSRLAPRNSLTLPRLELMAALLSTRLRSFLLERLMIKVDRVFHYTDSTVTYYWCTVEQPARWKTFVCNRVAEIQRNSVPSEWYHVPGPQNIADLATRGVSASDLRSNTEWWLGPVWLSLPEDERPARKLRTADRTEPLSLAVERRAIVAPVIPASPVVDFCRFSSWESAIRVLSNVMRFANYCRRKPAPADTDLRRTAEHHAIRWTQEAYFADELAAVKAGERPTSKSKLAAFTLFIDEHGLLRARTRLTKGPHYSYDEMNPLVLPGESSLAVLLILHYHRINAHFGVNVVLSALRRRFWITRGRQVIKALLRRCVTCRRAHGAAADQVQAPLPPERVTLVVPFASTGLDFCGPFFSRSREGTVKNYIALFTCASTRAVHLELVPAMSTPETHLALRRFLSSHPGCAHLVTDNARSFVKAASDIKRLFNSTRDPESRELLAQRRVKWSFNCPRAPWHGGFFERLVGTVKMALTKTLGRSLIGYEELRTVVCELAAVVNDRPLTYVEGEPEGPAAITPAQFLRGGPVGPALCSLAPLDSIGPGGVLPQDMCQVEQLRSASLQRTNYFKALSVRWYREYLLQLRTANLDKKGKPRLIETGDICLLKEDNVPRVRWNLVRVMESHVGRDGAVRTYTVKFANGYQSRRAAQLLCPLEVV